jgi:hypothetical protein
LDRNRKSEEKKQEIEARGVSLSSQDESVGASDCMWVGGLETGMGCLAGLGSKVRRRKPRANSVKKSMPLPLPAGKSRALHPFPRLACPYLPRPFQSSLSLPLPLIQSHTVA